MDEWLVDLETRLAFQEDAIDALNRASVAQERAIADLRAEVAELSRALRQVSGLPVPGPGEEPAPPHY